MHARLEHDDLVRAVRLGAVHRDLRVAQDVLDGASSWAQQGDADAGAHVPLAAHHADGTLHGAAEPLGDRAGVLGPFEPVEQDPEVVAAEARHEVREPQLPFEAAREDLEQFVARGAPQGVVELLEAVAVDQDDGAQPVRDAAALQQGVKAGFEHRAVPEPGERVVQGVVAQLLVDALQFAGSVTDAAFERGVLVAQVQLGLLGGGDVANGAARAGDDAVHVADPACADLDPGVAVRGDVPDLVAAGVGLAGQERAEHLSDVGPVVHVHEVERGAAETLGRVVAGEDRPGVVEVRPAPARVGLEDDVVDVVDDVAVQAFEVVGAHGVLTRADLPHREGGEFAEGGLLVRREARAGDRVDDAEGAHAEAVLHDEGRARVEADAGMAEHEGIVAEALVAQGVGNDEQVVAVERVGAEGGVAVGFAQVEAVAGLEPLPVTVDEADEDDGRAERGGGGAGDVVEGGLGRRVEQLQPPQQSQALMLVGRDRRLHREKTFS